MNIKPLLLALTIGSMPIAISAEDWSKEPLVVVQQAAQKGEADAQLTLATKDFVGDGVVQDSKQAVLWLRRAAEQGNARAQFNLGAMLADGKVVAKDDKLAVAWYQKAAKQGYAAAQFVTVHPDGIDRKK